MYEHATEDIVRDNIVVGVLPYRLACLTNRFIELSLDIPLELRGKELNLEQLKRCNPTLREYSVRAIDNIDINRGNFIKKFL